MLTDRIDAVMEEEIEMRVPTGVCRAVTHLVAMVASVLLVLVFMAVLPPWLGAVVLLGMIVVVGLVAVGVLEGAAVRLVTRAGAPTNSELQGLLTVHDLEQRRVLVRRSTAHASAPAALMGRFTVVSAALVEALHRGFVGTREVTALVVHARAHHEVAAARRGEVTIALVETPSRMVVAVFRGLGRAFAWMPLGSLAWRLRGVVGVVCLVQAVGEGRPWSGVLGAGVVALIYLVPAAARAVEARATAAGDAAVVRAGLGGVFVEVLDRSVHRLPVRRRQRLQAGPTSRPSSPARPAPPPDRHLNLVRS